MGVKCKQADLVSVYTLFCIEINKDGQGRDWKKRPGFGVCYVSCAATAAGRRKKCQFFCCEAFLVQKSLTLKCELTSVLILSK